MYVGIPSAQNLELYRNITRTAPIRFHAEPILYLTPPGTEITNKPEEFDLAMTPVIFRNLYNPANGIPSYCGGWIPAVGETLPNLYAAIGCKDAAQHIPYTEFCTDGMVSKSARQFCRALANSLGDQIWTFHVSWLDPSDTAFQDAYLRFNHEAVNELAPAWTFQYTRTL